MDRESAKLLISELRREVLARQKCICSIEELYDLDAKSEQEHIFLSKPAERVAKPVKTKRTRKEPTSDGTRRCNKCGEMKPLERFAPQKDCTGGRQGTCRDCVNKRTKERAAEKKYANGHKGTSEAIGFPTLCSLCHSAISSQQRYIHHMATVHPGVVA